MAIKKSLWNIPTELVVIIYCLLLLYAANRSLQKPAYNWDMLPYMGVVLSYDEPDIKVVHDKAYAIAKQEVPPVYYNRMVDPQNAYRNSVAQNAEAFNSQFPFYIVKPLYTRAVWIFYRMGMALPGATVLPSVIAYFITGLLLFFWMKKYWQTMYAFAGSLLLMVSPPVVTVAGLSSPDAVSGLLVFTAVYFLTETKSMAGAVVFLLLSIFARLDNILPAFCLLSLAFFSGKWNKPSAGKVSVAFGLMLFAYFIVTSGVRSFGWSVLYYPAFVKQLNSSYTINSHFNIDEYLSLIKTQLATGFYFSFISIFFFLVVLLLWSNAAFSFGKLTAEQLIAMLFVLIIVLRFILQPLIADRLYIPYYLSVMVFLCKTNSLSQVSNHY